MAEGSGVALQLGVSTVGMDWSCNCGMGDRGNATCVWNDSGEQAVCLWFCGWMSIVSGRLPASQELSQLSHDRLRARGLRKQTV
jgi:hypothetical protein